MSYLNAHNLRQRREAHERYRLIIEGIRQRSEEIGRFPVIQQFMAESGRTCSHFGDAYKGRPDLIQIEKMGLNRRAKFANPDGSWTEWTEWSTAREVTPDRKRKIREGQIRRLEWLRANPPAGLKERECLRCRSNGVKTMVLGGPGQRLCQPCRSAASDTAMGEGCSSGRRVGLSGYSVVSQIQPRAA